MSKMLIKTVIKHKRTELRLKEEELIIRQDKEGLPYIRLEGEQIGSWSTFRKSDRALREPDKNKLFIKVYTEKLIPRLQQEIENLEEIQELLIDGIIDVDIGEVIEMRNYIKQYTRS